MSPEKAGWEFHGGSRRQWSQNSRRASPFWPPSNDFENWHQETCLNIDFFCKNVLTTHARVPIPTCSGPAIAMACKTSWGKRIGTSTSSSSTWLKTSWTQEKQINIISMIWTCHCHYQCQLWYSRLSSLLLVGFSKSTAPLESHKAYPANGASPFPLNWYVPHRTQESQKPPQKLEAQSFQLWHPPLGLGRWRLMCVHEPSHVRWVLGRKQNFTNNSEPKTLTIWLWQV